MNNNYEILISPSLGINSEFAYKNDILNIPCEISETVFEIFMTPYLQAGRDIFIIVKDDAELSLALIAKEKLLSTYDNRNVIILNTNNAAISYENLLSEICMLRYEGKKIFEISKYYQTAIKNINHYVTDNYNTKEAIKNYNILKYLVYSLFSKHQIAI